MQYFLIVLCIFLAGCSREEAKHARPPTQVTSYVVQPLTIPADFTFVGRTQSSHLVEIRARVQGYLEEIDYQEGAMVNEGQLLFVLDPKPFQAALDSANAELNEQKALLWRAEQDELRLKPLFEQKAASKKDLDTATSQVLATKAAVEAAQAKVTDAELNLGYTKITAPSKGLSSESNYRIGALITPGERALLTTISGINPIWVMFSVSENEQLKSQKEREQGCLIFPKDRDFDVAIEFGLGDRYNQLGKVDFANPSYDPTTGMRSIRAVFPNPEETLKPGQFVRIIVMGAKRPGVLLVPKVAVQQGNNGFYVYVINKEGNAELRIVDLGDWFEEFWIVNDGLDKEDQVVVEGVNKIEPGSPLKVLKSIESPASSTPFDGVPCKVKKSA
jgi:membrane fusion protein (multidrug efflux system)